MSKTERRFFIKLIDNGSGVPLYCGRSYGRFLSRLRGGEDTMFGLSKAVYLRISYGKSICADGCLCEAYNDGYFEDRKSLAQAVEAFLEF